MNTRIRHTALLYTLLTLAFLQRPSLQAQDFIADIEAVNAHYASSPSMRAVIEVSGYEGSMEGKPYFTQRTTILRQGSKLEYLMGNVEMLFTDNLVVWTNKEQQKIICTPRSKDAPPSDFEKSLPRLDSLVDGLGDAEYLGKENSLKHYRIKQQGGEIVQYDIYVDAEKPFIKRICYTYNEQMYPNRNWLVMHFKEVSLSPAFKQGEMMISRYVYKDKQGVWHPSKRYGGYQVILAEERQ